jgi:multidrug resistance efflux pump
MSDIARSKAQAKVSEYEAEVSALEAQLADAQSELDGTKTASGLLDAVKDAPVIGGLTDRLRRNTGADQASAKATVDRIQAELTKAQTQLDWARKAQNAVDSVTDAAESVTYATDAPDITYVDDVKAPDKG